MTDWWFPLLFFVFSSLLFAWWTESGYGGKPELEGRTGSDWWSHFVFPSVFSCSDNEMFNIWNLFLNFLVIKRGLQLFEICQNLRYVKNDMASLTVIWLTKSHQQKEKNKKTQKKTQKDWWRWKCKKNLPIARVERAIFAFLYWFTSATP